jgi:hypothetical protein
LGQTGPSDELAYQGPRKNPKSAVPENKADAKPLPSEGNFAIECLGKNKILVGKQRVEHGEVAPLESGMTIKIDNYCLYFLLPTDATEKTMSIPNPAYKKPRKRPSTTDPGSLPNKKTFYSGGALKLELESMSVEDLIAEITALESDQLGHRHKVIRSIVTARGVRDAFRAKSIRKMAKEKGAVSKAAIMDWLAESDLYSEYVKHTLRTLETGSYQTSITKALVKAGCARIGSTGRFVMWKLPQSCLSDGEEEKHDDIDGPRNAPESESNNQGVRMNGMDEDSGDNEGDQEDGKGGEAEDEGVTKNNLDEDGDDDESDEEEKESQENQEGGKKDVDERSQDNKSEEEANKERLSEIHRVGKDGVNECSDDNEGDQEDGKGSEAEDEGVPKNDLDDDGDDDESDEEEKDSQENREGGKKDVDERSQDNKSEEEANKERPSEIHRVGKDGVNECSDDDAGEGEDDDDKKGGLNEDQFGDADDDHDNDSSDDESPSPAKAHDKEMDLDGQEEGSDNDNMEISDEGNDSSNDEIPESNIK